MNNLKLGTYVHYKNPDHLYEVICIAKHSETNEDMVVYKTLYDNPVSTFWIHPLKMFMEEVTVNEKKVPRFKYIGK